MFHGVTKSRMAFLWVCSSPNPRGRPCPLLVLTIADLEGNRRSLVALELARTLRETVAGAVFACSGFIHICLLLDSTSGL